MASFQEKGAGQSVYSEMALQAYESRFYLGSFMLPVTKLSPAAAAMHLCTRDLNEKHVEQLMTIIFGHRAGLMMRDALKVVLIWDKKDSNFSAGAAEDLIGRLQNADPADRLEMILKSIDHGGLIAVTIGGNHGREACVRLIRKGQFEPDLELRCDVFAGLDVPTARALGFIDNLVAQEALGYSLAEKVSMIRELSYDDKFVDRGSLTDQAVRICVFDIMYKSNATKKETTNPQSRIKSAAPFLKACRVPAQLWPHVRAALATDKISLTDFRSISWTHDPARLEEAFRNFNLEPKVKVLKKQLNIIKCVNKLKPALSSIWADLQLCRRISTSAGGFVEHINNLQDLDIIATRHKKNLLKVRAKMVYKSPELTKEVVALIETNSNRNLQSPVVAGAWSSVAGTNREKAKTIHRFQRGDATEVVEQMNTVQNIVGMVMIDPPFGVLQADWDVLWDITYWENLFTALNRGFANKPILVFLAEQQLNTVCQVASLWGFKKSRIYCWLKTEHFVTAPGRRTYPANLIVLLWSDHLNWQGEDASPHQNGNFVATPKVPMYSHRGEIVNQTGKPVILLRSFFSSFCPRGSAVLDLCSGSGSGALAAASLGLDSYSVDIRQPQIEASMDRIHEAAVNPSWYPSPEVIHKWSALTDQLVAAITPPAPAGDRPAPRRRARSEPAPSPAGQGVDGGADQESPGQEMDLSDEDQVIQRDADHFAPGSAVEVAERDELRAVDEVQEDEEESAEEAANSADEAFIDETPAAEIPIAEEDVSAEVASAETSPLLGRKRRGAPGESNSSSTPARTTRQSNRKRQRRAK